jgi:glycosyltransferase involved in cell wall biosynthesis
MNNLPRIALIIPGGIGTGKDNIGVPVLERIVGLLSNDFSVTVFQLFPRNKGYITEGFELVDIRSPFLFFRILKFFVLLLRSHRRKKFKVLHGFWAMPGGFLAVVAGKVLGIKSIVSVLGGDAIALPEIKYGQLINPLYRVLIFWTLKQANEVIVLTKYLEDNLKRSGFSRYGIRIIPWGIDASMFTYQEKPLGNPVRFLHIGNLNRVKDQATLLQAFKLIRDKLDSTLTIVGEGPCEKNVKQLISDLGLEQYVVMIAPVPYHELVPYYHASDVLLHTSLSEGQCEVVTEAMSAGVLVCGTSVGLMYDCPSCCVSVDVGNYDLLAQCVLDVIADPKKSAAIRNNAREWTIYHSIQWTCSQIERIYAE